MSIKVYLFNAFQDIQSRSDYPDFDDMNSFFDFDLIPSLERDKDYENQYGSESDSESSNEQPLRKKYYYYFKKDGPRYLFDPDSPSKKQVVTPGTHYKPENDKDAVVENASTESKPTLNQAVVGPYQVSVVDADSPVLSNLGLNKEDLMKLSGHTKRSTTNASMVGSGSVPAATYAETPRQEHPPPNYHPHHSHPPPPPSYEPSNGYGPDRSYRPSEYYPSDNQPPHRGYSSGQPPPQGSYDPKSYPPSHSPPSYNHPPPPSRSYGPYPPSYAPKRSSEVPWRQVSSSAHTDWDDKQNKKPEPYNGYSHYQTPPAHASKPSYTEKTGYRHSSYSSPSSSSSEYHSHKHSSGSSSSEYKPRPSGSGEYHSHKYSPSSSSEYHSHKPSYPSSSYSSSDKAPPPSRAGSVSYGSSHEASKPGITIRFKKSGHESGHGGSSGLSIPLNFNPLDVVKKLLPSLNPLNNKKVTIGITIENKNKPEYHVY
ncbi:hypothetical protein JTE90_025338 [Oedothorax gibbosus]|uniref:Uncharacterized protein n=1 Tax=Oedothorax gibbosus TaxID=931172 RepID=A0AAV6V5S7_9ARAC|nr:hypothetical protein JTE90_025338 [Oedothorax gibbosus]